MKNKWKRHFKSYMSKEILIEYKTCLYFFEILFFHVAYLWTKDVYKVHVLTMCAMIFSAYGMGYVQVYLLHNFDEAEKLGKREIAEILFCSGLYTLLSYLFRWFDRNGFATGIFFGYMIFGYICVYVINKIKREIDTEDLNRMLTEYKKGE